METQQTCPQCGVGLPDGSPAAGGLCPGCLLKLGDAVSDGTVTATTDPDPSAAPERIGPYRILETLGEGGMGTVYLAEQQEPVRRRVALKLIKWGMDTKHVIARFESERQALALMNHPNIARVFDGGATPEGRPYFVMEHVDGEPLTTYCDRQRLTTGERLRLFMEVCEGVQHAHQKGIIHRDLKPSNVLVRVQNAKPVPKIIDFGVAKATSQRLTEKTIYTQMGTLVGTPEYMSPEQAEMTSLDIDTRTDVYSLGVMLYELLVGALPFDPKELREAGFDEIRRRIREDEPSKPSTRISTLAGDRSAAAAKRRRTDLSSLRKRLRGDLDWITMKALEKDRTRRYGSPEDLARDVRRHLRHEPVAASPPSTAYRVQKFVRRHRLAVAAGSVTIVALIIGATLATIGMARALRAERLAKQEAETAKQVSDFLEGLFEVSDPGEARGSTITAREILDQGAEKIERGLADRPLVQARMMNTIGRVYRSLGLYADAEPLLDHALDLRRRELGERHPETARSMSELAWQKHLSGDLDEARRLGEKALRLQEGLLGPDAEDVAWSRYRLGAILQDAGDLDRGLLFLESALSSFEKRSGPNTHEAAWCLNDIGLNYFQRGKIDEALPYFERALTIKERVLGPDHWDTAMGRNNVAYVLIRLERYGEAKSELEGVLRSLRAAVGTDHPAYAVTLHSMGEVLLEMGDASGSKRILTRALTLQENGLNPTSVELALTLHTLAEAERTLREFVEAEQHYRRALAIRETLGADHPDLGATLSRLASLLREIGRDTEAEALESRLGSEG